MKPLSHTEVEHLASKLAGVDSKLAKTVADAFIKEDPELTVTSKMKDFEREYAFETVRWIYLKAKSINPKLGTA